MASAFDVFLAIEYCPRGEGTSLCGGCICVTLCSVVFKQFGLEQGM